MDRQPLPRVGLVAVLVLAAGCSDSNDGRLPISGKVKLHGQPIADGAIVLFEPLEKQDSAGSVTVSGGEYEIPRVVGLKPGKYLVRVTAGDGKTAVNPVDSGQPPGPTGGRNIISKELIPPDWNVNSQQKVTVTKGGPNKFDFDIP
jgi:hypothetical protein